MTSAAYIAIGAVVVILIVIALLLLTGVIPIGDSKKSKMRYASTAYSNTYRSPRSSYPSSSRFRSPTTSRVSSPRLSMSRRAPPKKRANATPSIFPERRMIWTPVSRNLIKLM